MQIPKHLKETEAWSKLSNRAKIRLGRVFQLFHVGDLILLKNQWLYSRAGNPPRVGNLHCMIVGYSTHLEGPVKLVLNLVDISDKSNVSKNLNYNVGNVHRFQEDITIITSNNGNS